MTTQTPTIAARLTATGSEIRLHTDGMLTWADGSRVRGLMPPPRFSTTFSESRAVSTRSLDLRAGWAFIELAGEFEDGEVPAAIKAIRRAFRRGLGEDPTPAEVRQIMVEAVEAAALVDPQTKALMVAYAAAKEAVDKDTRRAAEDNAFNPAFIGCAGRSTPPMMLGSGRGSVVSGQIRCRDA